MDNNSNRFRISVMNAPWYEGYEFIIGKGFGEATLMYGDLAGDTIKFSKKDEGCVIEPTFRMDKVDAQQLLNELWHCGLRPTTGEGDLGELNATKGHLMDMREITTKLLDDKLKG